MDGNAKPVGVRRDGIIGRMIRLLGAGSVVCWTATSLLAQQPYTDTLLRAESATAVSAPAVRWIGGNAVEDLPPISIDEFYRTYALREPGMTVVHESAGRLGRSPDAARPSWYVPVNDIRVAGTPTPAPAAPIVVGPPMIGTALVQPGAPLANYQSFYSEAPAVGSNAAKIAPPMIAPPMIGPPMIGTALRQPGSTLASYASFNKADAPVDVPPPEKLLQTPPAGQNQPVQPLVNAENQPIQAGDPIQPSQTTGANPQALTNDQKLGQAPENFSQQFLRRQSVLLGTGEWQVDVGVAYTLFEDDFTSLVLPPALIAETRIRRRLLTVPLELRYGITDTAQFFINAPLGYVNTELSFIGFDDFTDDGGIGDTNLGVSYLLCQGRGCGHDPDVILTVGATIPTSEATFLSGIIGTPDTTLGQGYWAAYWNLLFVHTYDPVVVFYGFGSRHQFEQEVDGFDVLPGGQYNYQLGVGFAVNSSITLSTAFIGSYISEAYVDDVRLQGSIQEPMSMRFAVTIADACRIVEPFAEIGMTDDAAAGRVGITWTY